jgi:hypothetical protein
MTVRWQEAEQTAEYATVVPEPSSQFRDFYPYPDLALLRVQFRGHPRAYLSADEPMADDHAFSWGYPIVYEGHPVGSLAYEGVTGGGGMAWRAPPPRTSSSATYTAGPGR